MFDEARTVVGMIKMCGLTQSEAARKMGVSQPYVANKVRLLNFSEEIQELILKRGLSERHARLLLRLPCDGAVKEAIEKISSMHLSVMASEALVDGMLTSKRVRGISEMSAQEGISALEDIISEGIKNLAARGVRVVKKKELYRGKLFLTLIIDSGSTILGINE